MNRWLFVCTPLLLCLGCAKVRSFPPADRDFAVSAVKKQCQIIPRHSGTPGAEQTAFLIRDMAKSISGVQVRIDSFSDRTPTGIMQFRNVVAELPGGNRKPVILAAHYDAKKLEIPEPFAAANDGGSGVAVLLAVMKVLSAEQKLPFPVIFLFLDGEECQIFYSKSDGLHGSRHAAEQYAGKAAAMILADMVGDKELQIVLPKNSSSELTQITVQSAEDIGCPELVAQGNLQIIDDHVPFMEAGIPSVDLIDFEYGPGNCFWHTTADAEDKISPESLGRTADLILRMLARIADRGI